MEGIKTYKTVGSSVYRIIDDGTGDGRRQHVGTCYCRQDALMIADELNGLLKLIPTETRTEEA